jgi:transposase
MGWLQKRRDSRDRQARIVAYYADGHSLRECAEQFGTSFQWVHQVIRRTPGLMHAPHVAIARDPEASSRTRAAKGMR